MKGKDHDALNWYCIECGKEFKKLIELEEHECRRMCKERQV